MSYCYFLIRLKQPYIKSLKDLDSIKRVENIEKSYEWVIDRILEALPNIQWDDWLEDSKKYPDKTSKSISSHILNNSEIFEVSICNQRFLHVNIDGSYNVSQLDKVKLIAENLTMSAFDVQTGEVVFYQK